MEGQEQLPGWDLGPVAETPPGYRARDRVGDRERARQWRMANPGRARASRDSYRQRHRDRILEAARRRYRANLDQLRPHFYRRNIEQHGITQAEFTALLQVQGGTCAVCRRSPRRGRLHIDHDHRCHPGPRGCRQCVRGLLCRMCNTALGLEGQPRRDDLLGSRFLRYLADPPWHRVRARGLWPPPGVPGTGWR